MKPIAKLKRPPGLDLHAQFSEYVTGNTVVAMGTVWSSNPLTLIVAKLSIKIL
jgi:hypothetical protein